MASTTIRRLLQPPSTAKSEERALEFLNTHFQTLAQLDNEEKLQRIVDESRGKTEDLREELRKSRAAVDELIKDTLSSTQGYLATAQELSLARHALTDELSSLSTELLSSLHPEGWGKPTLLEELESLHRNLKELESVRNYVLVIERALRLSEAAVAQAQSACSSSEARNFSPSCLTQYQLLQSFVLSVTSHCSSVENPSQPEPHPSVTQNEAQPLKIVMFLSKIRDRTWTDIKGIFTSNLLRTAEKLGWPQPIEYTSVLPDDRALLELEFLDLLKLQNAGNEIHESDPQWKRDGIYPIQALVSPIALRFKFHFESKRDTNRMDKPEWYFTHILNVTHTHRYFLETIVQPLLSATDYKHINAFREFTYSLLPLLTRKLRRTIPLILHHPSLLAHTIYQSLAFDASLRDQGFSLDQTTAATVPAGSKDVNRKGVTWEGISGEILGKKEWFEAWLEGEHKFADDQYNDIISSLDAWQIGDDIDPDASSTDADFRPTNSARRVKALIEQITDRYQPLPSFTARSRFLITIQLPILESYHSRISSSLDAFETLSSSFVRAVPGALSGQVGHGSETRKLTGGVEGMGRLVKAAVSAHYIAAEMERWGDDLFFLELWSDINARAALRAKADAHPLLPGTGENISTSQEVYAVSKGTIFQELVTQYGSLGERAEDMIVRHVCSEVESACKAYFISQWDDSENLFPDENVVSIPTTLVAPMSILSSHLTFLVRSLPGSFAAALYRRISSSLAAIIIQRRVLQRGIGRLTLVEAKRIAGECFLWIQACRMAMGRSVRRVEGPWARLLDAMKLLTLKEDQFHIAVGHIFDAGADGLESLSEELEISDLGLGELIDIVRLREDCWR